MNEGPFFLDIRCVEEELCKWRGSPAPTAHTICSSGQNLRGTLGVVWVSNSGAFCKSFKYVALSWKNSSLCCAVGTELI